MTLPFLKQCVLALFYTSIGLITCYETYTLMPQICLAQWVKYYHI